MNIKELKQQVKELGGKGFSKMKKEELLEYIEKLKKVQKKGLNRLDYTKANKTTDTAKKLKKTEKNKEILEKQRTLLVDDDILEKLKGYENLLVDQIKPGNNKWIRYFIWNPKSQKYDFKSGGFALTNKKTDPFITLFNRSQNFSWSVQKEVEGVKTVFFESGEKGKQNDNVKEIIDKYFNNTETPKRGSGFIRLDTIDYSVVHSSDIESLAEAVEGSVIGLRKMLREKRNKFKKFYITRGDKEKTEKIKEVL